MRECSMAAMHKRLKGGLQCLVFLVRETLFDGGIFHIILPYALFTKSFHSICLQYKKDVDGPASGHLHPQ